MYFVPVRKLLKILFVRRVTTKRERTRLTLHECMDATPDSPQRFCRRWSLLIIMALACVYIVFHHTNTKNIFFVNKQIISANNSVTIFNRNKGHVVKKTNPRFKPTDKLGPDLLWDINEKIKESNIASIVTTQESKVDQNTQKAENSAFVILTVPAERNEKHEPKSLVMTYDRLQVCRPHAEKSDNKEVNNKKILRPLKDDTFSEVKMGGYHYPKKCRSRHKVAILVPYRNREMNLAVFVYHMHPFLIRQQLEYRIFLIEQAGEDKFNRGKLFNVGFMEMMNYNEWHCVVLHDVDLLPLSDKILYTCPTYPRHMCGTVAEKAKLTYDEYHTLFGGVSALTVHHYKQINGFSNLYWGWGGEDNDMYWRILSARLPMVRYNKSIAKYKSLPHPEQAKNGYRYGLLRSAVRRYKTDGLSNLKYKVIWTKHRHLYTHIFADVNPL